MSIISLPNIATGLSRRSVKPVQCLWHEHSALGVVPGVVLTLFKLVLLHSSQVAHPTEAHRDLRYHHINRDEPSLQPYTPTSNEMLSRLTILFNTNKHVKVMRARLNAIANQKVQTPLAVQSTHTSTLAKACPCQPYCNRPAFATFIICSYRILM